MQGEVNFIHKLDWHYYGQFGFLAWKETSFAEHSANLESSLRIHSALGWLRTNNHLYSSFFSQYETLFQYMKPKFVNSQLPEKQAMSLDQLLHNEAVGMAFPIDATYFDLFPLIYDCEDVAGVQHPHYPHDDYQKDLQDLTAAKYGEKFLEPKTFPHLYPWGYGGWHYGCPLNFQAHVKMRLFDVRGWWVTDTCYAFFKYDYITKMRLRMVSARCVVNVAHLTESLNASKVQQGEQSTDPYAIYGTEVPRKIPGSRKHWKSFGLDLTAFVQQHGLPEFFVTFSANDPWPQMQSTLARGWEAAPAQEEYTDLTRTLEDLQAVGFHPHVSVIAAEKRFQWIM